MYQKVYDATIASFATSSSEVNLSKGWKRLWLEVPTMTSNSTMYLQAANAAAADGGVYRRIVHKDAASAAASVDFQTLSSCTGRMIEVLPAAGLQYFKVESQVVLSSTVTFKIVVSDDV